jgi:hypothetical protein
MGGLADRLRGLLTIFWAAYQSRRILLIGWTHPRPLEETLQPALYDWRLHGPCDAEMSVPGGLADNQLRWSTLLNESLSRPERYLCASTPWPYFGGGVARFPGVHAHVLRSIALQALFRPSDLVESAIRAMLFMAGGMVPEDPFTIMHFRHGGAGVGDGLMASPGDAQRFHKCALALRPGLPLLLLSDTVEGRASMRSMEPKPLLLEGETEFHVDKTNPDSSRAMRHGNVIAFASFFLIARSTCAVISNSGYSHMGLLMGLNTTTGTKCWAYSCDNCTFYGGGHGIGELANFESRRPVNWYDDPNDVPPGASGPCQDRGKWW